MMATLTIRERVLLTVLVSLLVTIFVRHTLAYGWSAAAAMAVIAAFVWAISSRNGGDK